MAGKSEVWSSGEGYERYVGRWSRLVAREFVRWVAVPPRSTWLDVGCGTGALLETISELASPASATGIDRSEAYVGTARARLAPHGFEIRTGDAQKLPFEGANFDAAVSGLVLNFVPDHAAMVAEMRRVVRPGGGVACYVWDYAVKMQMMRRFWDAAVALNPDAASLDEGPRFRICNPEPLKELFEQGGLRSVATTAIDVPTVFKDFDDYWTPFLMGDAPAPGYCMSLDEPARAALRDLIRSRLPVRPDGSIHLSARAWAVKGLLP